MFSDGSEKREKSNKYVSIAAGVFIAAGWWMFLDGVVASYSEGKVKFYEFLPPIFSTIGFFLINGLPSDMFTKNGNTWGDEVECYVKAILVLSIVLLFGSIVASIWIFLAVPMFQGDDVPKLVQWRGISEIAMTFCSLVSTFIWRFMWRDPSAY